MDLRITSGAKLNGFFRATKVFSSGKRELAFEDDNLIVLASKQTIIGNLYNTRSTDIISSINLGVGGCSDLAGLYPILESPAQTALSGSVFTASFSGATMAVTGSPVGRIIVGQTISGGSIPGSTTITAYLSGSGGAGTYTVSYNFGSPVSSETVTATSQVVSLSLTVAPDLTHASVTFLATLDQTTGNGYALSEAGLFTASTALFSIKNHPSVTKTIDFAVQYSWTISCL